MGQIAILKGVCLGLPVIYFTSILFIFSASMVVNFLLPSFEKWPSSTKSDFFHYMVVRMLS